MVERGIPFVSVSPLAALVVFSAEIKHEQYAVILPVADKAGI